MLSLIEITVRGFHLDVFGHVNNARILEFMEEARWAIFEPALKQMRASDHAMAIVNANINYRRVATLYQRLHVDGRIVKFSNRSFVMAQQIQCAETGQLIADANFICVIVANATSKAIPITDYWRLLLQPA